MLTWIEEDRLSEWGRGVPDGTRLLLRETPDARSAELAGFCERLEQLVPQLRVVREEGAAEELPALVLPSGVRFCGVPHGTETAPFCEALAGRLPAPAAGLIERLASASLPASLELFIAPHCPHCPQAVRALAAIAAAAAGTRLTVIDGTLFAEAAEKAGIRSAPALVLDGRYRWSGVLPLEEVAALIATRDPLTLGPASIEVMLKEGAASNLVQMMVEADALMPALVDLVCHPQWPVRLGAMVTVEGLAESRPTLAAQALEEVWARFESAADPVKGDILFLCGEVGGRDWADRVQAVAEMTPSANVREAAREALESLRQKEA